MTLEELSISLRNLWLRVPLPLLLLCPETPSLTPSLRKLPARQLQPSLSSITTGSYGFTSFFSIQLHFRILCWSPLTPLRKRETAGGGIDISTALNMVVRPWHCYHKGNRKSPLKYPPGTKQSSRRCDQVSTLLYWSFFFVNFLYFSKYSFI